MAAVPYDFKEAYCENQQFAKTFEGMINLLYENTGRKVNIIAHSYGNLNSYFQILNNSKLKEKINSYIAIAPPLTGSYKAPSLIFRGSNEFLTQMPYIAKINFSPFAMSLSFPFLGVGYQLLPYNYLETINQEDVDNLQLISAFEKYLKYSTCKLKFMEKIKKNLKINSFEVEIDSIDSCDESNKEDLINLFPDYLGWLNDKKICKKADTLQFNQQSYKDNYSCKLNINDNVPEIEPCGLYFFELNKCPIAKNKSKGINYADWEVTSSLCKSDMKTNKDYIKVKTEQDNNSLNSLIKKSHTPMSHTHGLIKLCKARKIPVRDDSEESLKQCKDSLSEVITDEFDKENFENTVDYHYNACTNKKDQKKIHTLEHPGVKVYMIYSRGAESKGGFLFDDLDKNRKPIKREHTSMVPGDGTVNADSALFPALKWSMDKTKPKVTIFDYCAPIDDSSNFDKDTLDKYFYVNKGDFEDKNYLFVDCKCKSGSHYKDNIDECTHAEMINDPHIVDLIVDITLEERKLNPQSKHKHKKIKMNPEKKCREIFKNIYLGSDYTSQDILAFKKKKLKRFTK